MPEIDNGLRVLRFWTDYVPKGDGTFRSVDKVETCTAGGAALSTTVHEIDRIRKVRPVADPVNDIVGVLANLRWDTIRPAYEAWKAGEELPETGTPLGAWPALTAEQLNAFRAAGVKTVEDVATCGEQQRNKIPLPGLLQLIDQAKHFLANKDKTAVSAELAHKDEQIKELQTQVAEMFELLKGATDPQDAPRRRGRPPKVQPDEDAQASADLDEVAA